MQVQGDTGQYPGITFDSAWYYLICRLGCCTQSDGHDFIEQAIGRGSAVICEH
jgi:hypothetical protein